MQRVEYIGRKPRQTDTVAGTSTVWIGAGDVQEVPDEAWDAMSKHPFVWRLAEPATSAGGLGDAAPGKKEVEDFDLITESDATTPGATAAESDSTPQAPDLNGMNTAQLRDYALAKGYAVDLSQKAKDLRPAIRAIEEAKA